MHQRPDVDKVPPLMDSNNKAPVRPRVGTVLIQTLIPAAVGAFLHYKGKPVASGVLFGIAAVLLVSGLLIPVVFNAIEKAGQALGRAVSMTLTWALLVPMFILVFVPGRLILIMRGLDPLCRKFPTDAATYWIPRNPVVDPEEYKRQY